MKVRKENAITLISLAITVIVILIISSVATYSGKEIIRKGKLEELRTNMLLIQAKAKEYVEDANFKMGLAPDETRKEEVRKSVYVDGAKLEEVNAQEYGIDNSSVCYKVTKETLNIWGLDKIELKDNEDYLIAFDDENATVEIYNTKGFVDDNGDTRNSLTDIEEIR